MLSRALPPARLLPIKGHRAIAPPRAAAQARSILSAPQRARPSTVSRGLKRQPSRSISSHAPHRALSTLNAGYDLKELGANRTVRIVLIVALCIVGTAETVFYGSWLWRKFRPQKGVAEGESEGGR